MRNKKTEERLPEALPTYSGNERSDTVKAAPVGALTFMRPSYTDPWSGQTYLWSSYTNLHEREVIIIPQWAQDLVATPNLTYSGVSLRGAITDSGITDLDELLKPIDWFWGDIYYRLAFNALQQGKRVSGYKLIDPLAPRALMEKWLFAAIGIYGIKSLWDAAAIIPAVANWKMQILTTNPSVEIAINELFTLIHSYPIPQGLCDIAAYYGVGVAADVTGPVFVRLATYPDDAARDVLRDVVRGTVNDALMAYLTYLRDSMHTITTFGYDAWTMLNILAVTYPTPTPRSTVWRTDPEAVRMLLSEAIVRTTGGLTWVANPREDAASSKPVMIPIHGKSPYVATLIRPHCMIGTGIATPDWAWGSLGTIPWNAGVSDRESRLLVLNNRSTDDPVEWARPDGSIDLHDDSNPFNQFLFGPPTIDDHELDYDKQIQQHHRFQDESLAYITRQDMVLNTVAMFERIFAGVKRNTSSMTRK